MNPLYHANDQKRLIWKEEETYRSAFRRDNGRVIHSPSFRRLQGKTQLFPSHESDFFRNRLTHSLEVAQIAKSIVERLNFKHPYFKKKNINSVIVETASLMHDIGHPPFGHNGERSLDDLMKSYGGFEGNAQTIRILNRTEKKDIIDLNSNYPIINGCDERCGLNLTYRTIASVLKYDHKIGIDRSIGSPVEKGYYYTEHDIIKKVKENVLRDKCKENFKTIECQIMDFADDIANATYDLEDSFKGKFLSPLKILNTKPELIKKIADKINKTYKDIFKTTETETMDILAEIYDFVFVYGETEENVKEIINLKNIGDSTNEFSFATRLASLNSYLASEMICSNGYWRVLHTSSLIKRFIKGIEIKKIKVNNKNPCLTKIEINDRTKKEIAVLITLCHESVIKSPSLKIVETRGYDIIKEIFTSIINKKPKGIDLLPRDFRKLYDLFSENVSLQMRVICDFIAGMSDRYALEFYSRLKSENPQTIFKPF